MSCQQASRFISTSAASVTPEDPYVFTETVPTTPPFLYNTQKSRSRYSITDVVQHPTAVTAATIHSIVAPKTTISIHKLPLGQLNDNIAKAPASLVSIQGGSAPTTIFKNVTKSQKQNDHLQQNSNNSSSNNATNKKIVNLCILRPEQAQHQHQQLQVSSPLPQHTPSLWQTPLLLDTAIPMVSPPTSPASLPSPTLAQSFAVSIAETTLISAVAAPIAATLPPSKFHHTTLAQHLQKVQSIKKPKQKVVAEPNLQRPPSVNAKVTPLGATSVTAALPLLQPAARSAQHSVSDLNDIPVNVIFRKPQNTSDVTRTPSVAGDAIEDQENVVRCVSTPTLAPIVVNATLTAAFATTTATAPAKCNSNALKVGAHTLLTQLPEQSSKIPTFVSAVQDDFATSGTHYNNYSAQLHTVPSPKPHETSSNATPSPLHDLAMSPTCNELKLEKAPLYITLPKSATVSSVQPVQNRKMSVSTSKNHIPASQKKSRKSSTVTATRVSSPQTSRDVHSSNANSTLALEDNEPDTTASQYILPYCLQHHWLTVHDSYAKDTLSREERINMLKNTLRRQAMQYLSTHKLQKLPFQEARQRVVSVDMLFRKYQNSTEDDAPTRKCEVEACASTALIMSSYCLEHIVNNTSQQIFLPCTAKFADNTQCRIPVFNMTNEMPLCAEHASKYATYKSSSPEQHQPQQQPLNPLSAALYYENRPQVLQHTDIQVQKLQQQPQQLQHLQYAHMQNTYNKKTCTQKTNQVRKRRINYVNPVGRPQKRNKKPSNAVTSTSPPPLTAVLKRKSSTTSLESIASNSHSSNSQPQFMPTSLAPPALAPLSGSISNMLPCSNNIFNFDTIGINSTATAAITAADDLKEHEINQIVAQFATVANSNFNIGNISCSNNNNINLNFINANSDSNFTSALGSSSSLPSTDELLTQDMLSICENSSAYASSEDTGLGGLSETELMAGAHDADDIPLVDTRLLEEQDLANVLSTLPVDAFNELFNTVRQDEYDEVERALELADKHLKSLQQTIGTDSDFLGDLLDVTDDFITDTDICNKMEIVSSVMHSPHSSDIDPSALFDNGGNGGFGIGLGGGNSTTNSCPATVPDVRGLLQT